MLRIHGLGLLLIAAATAPAAAQVTTRASVSTAGAEGDLESLTAEISQDGRWVAFASDATNLVLGDGNSVRDVYLRDRLTGTTLLVSQSSTGEIGGFLSTNPDVSSAGPFVVFESPSFNLVPMDGNASTDVFVRDVTGGLTILVSVDSAGTQGNRNSFNPSISDDGRFVAFDSSSSNLIPVDANNQQDVFVRDLLANSTFRVSVSTTGAESNNLSGSAAISADGTVVAFASRATNLVENDVNQRQDVFVHEIGTGVTARVSVASDGTAANQDCFFPSLSADGRFVAFQSTASNLVPGDANAQSDVFVYDRTLGTIERVSVSTAGDPGAGQSSAAAISGDGRYVAFQSTSANLDPADLNGTSDVFVRDRFLATTVRLSETAPCGDADAASSVPSTSFDGQIVAYQSLATNLVDADANAVGDVFVRDANVFGADGVFPSIGSERGGETARIPGFGFPDAGSVDVRFGGAPATVIAATAFEIRVRVPASTGTGTVDVTVATPAGCVTVPRRYTYVDHAVAVRFGNVNLALGDRENVVLVNGRSGNLRREVVLGATDPFRLEVLAPSSRLQAPFVLYVWPRIPGAGDATPQPGGIGTMVFPTPLTPGAPGPQPRRISNSIGISSVLGVPNLPSPMAPGVVLSRPAGALPVPLAVAFQGIIRDDGSLIRQKHSITNAVVLRVQ